MSALLAMVLLAAPASRLTYESKCLYCHSADVTEGPRLTDAGWRGIIDRMRRKAPLLIHKSDVPHLAAYLTQVAGRVPAGGTAVKKQPDLLFPPEPELSAPPPPPEEELKRPEPEVKHPDDPALRAALEAQLAAQQAAQQQLDEEGQSLLERRCSKCHSLTRVFMRLDTAGSAVSTLERMRWKTGSGISDDDAQLLVRFLRSQF
jgi:cytochrome c5